MITLFRHRERSAAIQFARFWIATSLTLLAMTGSAHAAPLIADLSNYQVTMDSTFNGTRMFVFGTRAESGDVVVVVRGPTRDFMVRKKKEMGGIWINADRMKLRGVPDYYAIASSKPLSQLGYQPAFNQLAIGHDALFPSSFSGQKLDTYREFSRAFIQHQQQRRLYRPEVTDLTFMGETLFKTVIEFPDNIPPGTYSAEIYLLADHEIVGSHVLPIEVHKIGIDAFLYDYAHHQPFLYGISAVVLGLSAGWFAGRLFERF